MIAILTQMELDDVKCETPGCHSRHSDGIELTSTCHPLQPLAVWYAREDGLLVLRCTVCAHVVARIEVAP